MRVFTLLVLALIGAAPAYAGVGTDGPETWYVRPAGACPHSGDGLAYECANAAGQSGAFVELTSLVWTPTTGIDDGDTLYVCGTHRSGISLVVAGASGRDGAPITVNFDCPGDSGLIRHVTSHPEALVPELRLATGRLPETSEERSTLVIVLFAPSIDLFVRTSADEAVINALKYVERVALILAHVTFLVVDVVVSTRGKTSVSIGGV